MVQLCDAVREHGADIGFAHDADADRVAIVTDAAEPIGEDYSLVWAVAHVLKNRRQGPVVTNLSTSLAVEMVAREHGCELVRTPVGDINVSGTMRDIGAVIGGEGNGGVIIPDIQFGRDGIAAIALTLEFLAKSDMRASEIALRCRIRHSQDDAGVSQRAHGSLMSWLKSKEKRRVSMSATACASTGHAKGHDELGACAAFGHRAVRAPDLRSANRNRSAAHPENDARRNRIGRDAW
jgi:phosphomannomutase